MYVGYLWNDVANSYETEQFPLINTCGTAKGFQNTMNPTSMEGSSGVKKYNSPHGCFLQIFSDNLL